MDINDPRLSIRRLRNFVDRLPDNSELVREVAKLGPEARDWDSNTYMLANLLDVMMALDWHTVAAHSKNKPKPPKPFPRPKPKETVRKQKPVWPGKTIVDRSKANG